MQLRRNRSRFDSFPMRAMHGYLSDPQSMGQARRNGSEYHGKLSWRLKMKDISQLENRKIIALESITRHLSAIEGCLLAIVDGNDKSLRMKDIERAKVYSKHLGRKLR